MFSFPFFHSFLPSSNRSTSLDLSEAFATEKAGSLAMQASFQVAMRLGNQMACQTLDRENI
jgi:hypothetical protein